MMEIKNLQQETLDAEEIAKKVVELLKKEEPKASTGWGAFFDGGKK